MFQKSLFLALVGLFVLSCGQDKNLKKSGDFSVGKYAFLPPVSQGENKTFIALNALPDRSKNKIDVEFKLENSGTFNLVLFADKNLNKGVSFNFGRNNNKNTLEVSIQGAPRKTDLSEKFSKKVTTANIRLTVEVHNDEQPAHIIITQGSEIIFNSEGKKELAFESPGIGASNFWGFSTNSKATIQNIHSLEAASE